ncbi:MAG: NUDIX hydrolase [Clostridia bacterium]|nr:NUDIX hydrolase [Clostridia bacterium]
MEKMNIMNEIEIVNKEKKYEGKVFDIYEYKINIQNDTIKRDIMERKDGVVIVPIDKDGNLIMLSEYCAGSNSYNLAFPGGSMESDSIEENAQRELIEEIGFKSNNLKLLISTYEHPSTTNRKIHIFLARDLEKAYLKNEDRFIKIKRMSIEKAIEKCENDFCSDITTIAILSILKNYNKEE